VSDDEIVLVMKLREALFDYGSAAGDVASATVRAHFTEKSDAMQDTPAGNAKKLLGILSEAYEPTAPDSHIYAKWHRDGALLALEAAEEAISIVGNAEARAAIRALRAELEESR
jgi:hypothetical protein